MKKSWACLAIGVAVVMILTTASARAGSLKIWMDKFTTDFLPVNGQTLTLTSVQNPSGVAVGILGPKNYWAGWAPINLPVGTTIQSVVVYHGGGGGTVASGLYRVKFGKTQEVVASAVASETDPTAVPLVVPYPSRLVITEGYRYFIEVSVGTNAIARGVKITY